MENVPQIPEYLDFSASIKFRFNTPELAEHFSNIVQPGLEGQRDGWPIEFTLGDYPWDRFRVNSVDRNGRVVRVNVSFRANNDTEMSDEDFENAVLDNVESLKGVDANEWMIESVVSGRLNDLVFGGRRRNRNRRTRNRRTRNRRTRNRRNQKGGEALPMPPAYLGNIPGMKNQNSPPGQDLALPHLQTDTVRPFLPIMGGKRRKGGFVPSIMEPFATSAAQYATPLALYAGYKFITRKSPVSRRKNARKTRRN